MASGKVLQTVVEIAGSVSPTLGKAVGETAKKLEKVNLKAIAIGAAAAGGMYALGKGAVSAGKSLVNLGSQFDSAADAIRIGTGASGEALDALMDDFNAVYESVPTTMEDASKAISDYNTRLGLTGDELQGMSKQAIQVADMLGEDLSGVVESSSEAFQQWNIDAKDMGGAMDFVFKASQSTGVGFSDLMTTVQSFGPQLQEMGYSFEEATALVGQLEKAGVNTEEVLGAMKKSTSALAKEGIGAAEGMSMYADAIKNAKDMTSATQIAAEIFGTRGASTMAAAIRDGSISVDDLTKSLMENGETISGCAEDTYDYAERMQMFKQKAQVALEPLSDTMFNALNDLMPVFEDLMAELLPVIQDLAAILGPLIADCVAQIGPMLARLIPPLAQLIASLVEKLLPPLVNIITSILPTLISLAEMLLPIIIFVAESILPILVEILNAILPPVLQIVETVLPVLASLLNAILPILTQLISSILPIIVSVLDMVLSLLGPILNLVMAIATPIINLISSALQPLMSLLSLLINNILKPLMPIIQFVADLFSGVLGVAISTITAPIEFLINAFSGLIDFVTNIFAGGWESAWNGIVDVFKNIVNAIPTAIEWVINGAIDLINGIISGINAVSSWVGLEIDLIPHVELPKFAKGGFTEGVSIAGEEAMEAVISFDPAYREQNIGYWYEAGQMLGVVNDAGLSAASAASMQMADAESSANESPLTVQAGKLIGLDNFSLGSMTETTIIYYDFSGFNWSPNVEAGTAAEKEDILVALKKHASEFFDWLDEWIKQKEVGCYDRVSIY